MSTASSNVSADLLWEVARNQNAYLVKRKSGGGVQFSRDPYNLTNKHSRTHAGYINPKAVSIQPNGDKGVTLGTKKAGKSNTPAKSSNSHKFKAGSSNQKTYKAIADAVGKNGYRGDLNQSAVARASAILESQGTKKDAPESKPRGNKAKKTEA